MNKRFSTGKVDKCDFTKPCKLTRQKRWTENPQELVRHQHKALCNQSIVKAFYISEGQRDEKHKITKWKRNNLTLSTELLEQLTKSSQLV